MSGDDWANVRASGVTLEVPEAKDLLELCFWKGCVIMMIREDEKKGWEWLQVSKVPLKSIPIAQV